MSLRPLNDCVIIDVDGPMMAVDDHQMVLDAVNAGLIFLPEKNSVMKLSNRARVISYGPDCYYKFKHNQEIIYEQFADQPMWIMSEGKRYRVIKYHYIQAVVE